MYLQLNTHTHTPNYVFFLEQIKGIRKKLLLIFFSNSSNYNDLDHECDNDHLIGLWGADHTNYRCTVYLLLAILFLF